MISALTFLTIFGRARTPDHRTLAWFPLTGAAIGAVLGSIWWLADKTFTSTLLIAALVLLADLVITGMLHLDGLADSIDGLLPHLDRKRRIEVMRDPGVGAFALGLVPTIMLIRWIALFTTPQAPRMLIGLWMLSRTLIATAPAWIPYAHDAGLASSMLAGSRRWFVVWFIPVAYLLISVDAARGPAAIGLAVAAGTAVLGLGVVRLGGFTGDILGAAVVVAETVGLVAMAAR